MFDAWHLVLFFTAAGALALMPGPGIFYVAARTLAGGRGEGLASILVHEILPNSLRPLGVEYGLRLTYSTLFISALSFLGLGIQPPQADWGGLVRENLSGVQLGTYLPAMTPALAIGIFAIGLNLIVDWLGSEGARPISDELR